MFKKKRAIILDTSIFVNPDSYRFFGNSPLTAITYINQTASKHKNLVFYMPPAVYQELIHCIQHSLPSKITTHIHKKPPSSYKTPLSALFFYELVEETRGRVNKGMRIVEKYIRKALQGGQEQELIKSSREEYRMALREGIIDSKQDFDLILLAYELKAGLATSDQGLINWAQKLGIPCLSAEDLKEILI